MVGKGVYTLGGRGEEAMVVCERGGAMGVRREGVMGGGAVVWRGLVYRLSTVITMGLCLPQSDGEGGEGGEGGVGGEGGGRWEGRGR